MCTSFVAYFNEPIYGKNFDLDNPSLKFRVTSDQGIDRFHFSVNFIGKNYIDAAVLNSRGLYYCHLALLEDSHDHRHAGHRGTSLFRTLDNLSKESGAVQDFLRIAAKKRLKYPIHPVNPDWKIHSMIADGDGDAVIFEEDPSGNVICPMEGKFMVITNFANRFYQGADYQRVSGVGDDRYKLATEMLLDCGTRLEVDSGFEILKQTAQFTGDCPTQCSMIFRPLQREVYLCVYREFDKVYRVSLAEKMIETYRGFENFHKKPIGSRGISGRRLAGVSKI